MEKNPIKLCNIITNFIRYFAKLLSSVFWYLMLVKFIQNFLIIYGFFDILIDKSLIKI